MKETTYRVPQNVWFMVKLAWTSGEKKVLALGLLSALLAVALNLARLYISPAVLAVLEKQASLTELLKTIGDLERISDHALNVAEAAQEIHQKGITFSGDARHELSVLTDALREILHNAIRAFIMEDLELAKRVEPLEELIDALFDEMKLHHVDRLQKGVCTLSQGFVFNDLLTNYERVADHCSNIAVAMIELEADSFDTHEYLSSVKAMKSAAYERYYEEYRQQFAL